MRLHRFFLPNWQTNTDVVVDDSDLVHQWTHVFRMQLGQELLLCDGKNHEALGEIIAITKRTVTVRIGPSNTCQTELGHRLVLAFALLKRENIELILQKGTELGVTEFQPILSERTIKTDIKRPRLEAILKEAMEQSGRGVIPLLQDPIDLTTFLKEDHAKIFCFDSEGMPWSQIAPCERTGSAAVVIGPEGGWSEGERTLLRGENVIFASLGPRVLRAETAAIAALSLLVIS